MGMLLFVTRFALVLCAFVVGFAFLFDAVAYATAFFRGSSAYPVAKPSWLIMFAIVWLLSFFLAWRVAIVPLLGDRASTSHRTVVER
jgi:hypothetical protein